MGHRIHPCSFGDGSEVRVIDGSTARSARDPLAEGVAGDRDRCGKDRLFSLGIGQTRPLAGGISVKTVDFDRQGRSNSVDNDSYKGRQLEIMICSSCGRDNPDDVAYCLDCGRKLERAEAASPRTPPLAAPPSAPAAPVAPAPVQAPPSSPSASPAPVVTPPSPPQASSPAPVSVTPVSPGTSPDPPVPESSIPLGSPCPRCGVKNPATMNFCKSCGASLVQDQGPPIPAMVADARPSSRVCERCQGVLDADAQFCKFCGKSLGPIGGGGPPEPAIASDALKTGPMGGAPSVKAGSARLVAILKDGSEGQTYPLSDEVTEIGRKEGNILLPDDPYLSPRHARISTKEGRYFLKDLVTTNGVYLRIREQCRLHHGDVMLIGQQVLRFEVLEEAERGLGPASQHGTLLFGTPESGCIARLCQMTTEGIVRDIYHLRRPEVIIGREGPDIMFPDDPFMSRRHARISHDGASRTFVLEDLGSFNGTSLRFRGERELRSGDQFRVGNHLFLFEISGVEL